MHIQFSNIQLRNGLTALGIALVIILLSFNTSANHHADKQQPESLDSILSSQPDEAKTRYQYRHPKETLEFFGIQPGMNVIEVLPGRGWYTKILLPALGENAELIGVDYPLAMWPNFSFMTPERVEEKKTWIESWIKEANAWRTDNSATLNAFQFAEMPESFNGTVDAALFIRALHNLARYNNKGGYLDIALVETYKALKPGGIVGVVQHQAREDRPDSWADGNNGYLKKSFVVSKMQEHGFELVDSTDINENPKDQAGEGNNVWRLPPSLRLKDKSSEMREAMIDIGESNRMTLLFRKPLAEK